MVKILMVAGDFTEDYEVMVPFQTLSVVGVGVDVVCPRKRAGDTIITAIHDFEGFQTYTEKPGHKFTLNASFDTLILENYGGLFLTGGRSSEYLRLDREILNIVKWFMAKNFPVAAICHGVQILTAADVVRGRKLTAYPAVRPEVTSCGGSYAEVNIDESVVDGNLITAPAWPGNVAILRDFINALGIKIN
jgi:protease I